MALRAVDIAVWVAAVSWPVGANAFRNCDIDNSDAWFASTRYTVSEIEFDPVTGLASGSRTIYNYANHYRQGGDACHVTYELSGSYGAGSGTFVLDARRTNVSHTCPPEVIARDYPVETTYAVQMQFEADGAATMRRADSGEFMASGAWGEGRTVFTTPEICTAF
jgi:hypothetical protein